MKALGAAIVINLVFSFIVFGAGFRNLNWGMSQQEVIAISGEPVKETKNRVV